MSLIFRTFALVRGFAGRVLRQFERRNPALLLENERENLRKLIGQFNEGLVAHATVWERLISQVSRSETEAAELAVRVRACVKAGDRDAAGKYALDLQRLNAQLVADRSQLVASEQTYKNLVRRRDEAVGETRHRIEQVRRQIGDLKVKRAIADLEGMANAMIGSISSSGDSLARLQDMVGEEREVASARARVATGNFDSEAGRNSDALNAIVAEEALAAFLTGQETPTEPKALPDYSIEIDSQTGTTGRKEKIQ